MRRLVAVWGMSFQDFRRKISRGVAYEVQPIHMNRLGAMLWTCFRRTNG